jgi:hypothetical protein
VLRKVDWIRWVLRLQVGCDVDSSMDPARGELLRQLRLRPGRLRHRRLIDRNPVTPMLHYQSL